MVTKGLGPPPHLAKILMVSENLEISSPKGHLPSKGNGPHVVILTPNHALKLQGLLRGHTDLD